MSNSAYMGPLSNLDLVALQVQAENLKTVRSRCGVVWHGIWQSLQVYSMDISPNYAATIYGFASGLGNSAGFFLGLLMDYVIEGTVCLE